MNLVGNPMIASAPTFGQQVAAQSGCDAVAKNLDTYYRGLGTPDGTQPALETRNGAAPVVSCIKGGRC